MMRMWAMGLSIFLVLGCGLRDAVAASFDGKALALQWCSGCHAVQPGQVFAEP